MNNTKLKVVAVLAIVLVGASGVGLYIANNSAASNSPQVSTQQQAPAKATTSDDKKTVSYEGQNNKTALEVLKSLTSVETTQSSYGEFVTAINGLKADSNKQFWSFYVGGVMASEGAGTYKTTAGEKIEWRLEDIKQ